MLFCSQQLVFLPINSVGSCSDIVNTTSQYSVQLNTMMKTPYLLFFMFDSSGIYGAMPMGLPTILFVNVGNSSPYSRLSSYYLCNNSVPLNYSSLSMDEKLSFLSTAMLPLLLNGMMSSESSFIYNKNQLNSCCIDGVQQIQMNQEQQLLSTAGMEGSGGYYCVLGVNVSFISAEGTSLSISVYDVIPPSACVDQLLLGLGISFGSALLVMLGMLLLLILFFLWTITQRKPSNTNS